MTEIILAQPPPDSQTATPNQIVAPNQGEQSPADTGQSSPVDKAEPANEPNPPITLQDVARTVDTIKELVQHLDRDLDFRVDDITGKTVVTVLNKQTQEVIRQIPNEALLSMAQRLRLGGGLMEDLTG